MKNKKEQIEEMAKCMGEKNFLCADDCENCIQIPCKCKLVKQSKLLYKAGYRKATEVIDEFVERFKEENEISFRRYGKGIGISTIVRIADEMRQEVEK